MGLKQSILFEAMPGDNFDDVAKKCIAIREHCDDDIFLCFNGATIRIEKRDYYATVSKKYDRELHMMALETAENMGFIDFEKVQKDMKINFNK
jgi:hypothetical protein